jgi:hypothetical protein
MDRPTGEIPIFPIAQFRLVRRLQTDGTRSRVLQQRHVSLGGRQDGTQKQFWRDEWRDVPIMDEEDA